MNDGRLQPDLETVQEIFAEAIDLPPNSRNAMVEARCGGDVDLRIAVLELLTASDRAGRFMSDPMAAITRAAASDPVETQIGEFKIIRLLGEGGFGSVFLAEQEHPVQRQVALKVIKLGMDTAQVVARFQAERQALAMMDHPNIAKVYDAGATAAGRPYFVMELVNGVPITQYCDANRLTIHQRLELFIPVCLAVAHAHQKGIIHRDIKPTNVLVAVHDGMPLAKVIDFGIAKATVQTLAEQTRHSLARPMIGTLDYMSPEQADLNDRDVDTRSDIYSLGVLLYEMLTGKTPFDGQALREKGYTGALQVLREVESPRPSKKVSEYREKPGALAQQRDSDPRRLAGILRGDLDWVVMRCLEKEKNRRYQTAGALADDIRHYLNHEPVSAGPATASYRARKFIVRHKASVVVIFAVTAGLLLAAAGATIGMFRARASQKEAEQSAIKANLEAARANSVSDFMRGVFALAQPESGAAGEVARMDDVLKRTSAEIDARLRGRPQEQVMASRMLAEACRRLQLHDMAAGQLQRAYDLSRSLAGQEHSELTLELASELVLELYVSGKGDSAIELARSNLADCRKSFGDNNPITWKATNACAVVLSEVGAGDETFAMLKALVERVRSEPRSRSSGHLAIYQGNLAVCLRDRGDHAGANAAIRAAAETLKIDRLDAGVIGADGLRSGPPLSPEDLSNWIRGVIDRDADLAYNNAWLTRQIVESGGFPEAIGFLERYVAAAMLLHPGGTPTLTDRIDDLAMLKLRSGDAQGAAAAFSRAIELRRSLRGHYGMMEQTRWRTWTLCSATALYQGWRSVSLRDHVWCALGDLLRDHPPARLVPQETPVERLRFKLFRWPANGGGPASLVGEGFLDELRELDEPATGLYLLGLEVPRLGEPPLRRACWLLISPWSIETRPIPRFDVARSMPSDANLEKLMTTGGPMTQRTASALALDDALALMTEKATRLNWFAVRATTRLNLPGGMYRISVTADDGVRVWVDGRLSINTWYPETSTTKDSVVVLEAGEHDIKVEYFQQVGGYSLWLQVAPVSGAAKPAMLALGGGVPQLDSQLVNLGNEISEAPGERNLRVLRARALARRGRFAEAETEFAEATRLESMNHQHAYLRALLLAHLGDEKQYSALCRGMFDRFSAAKDDATRENLIRACTLGANLPVDEAAFGKMIDQIGDARGTMREAIAMAHYRLGQFDKAAGELRTISSGWSLDQATVQASGRLMLAMSLKRTGKEDEARAEFNVGRHLVGEAIPIADVEDLDAVGLENWLTCQIIWRQANRIFAR